MKRDKYLHDYYEGFEREREIIFYFRDKDNQKYIFNMWDAYFYSILSFLHHLKFGLGVDLSSDLVLHYCCLDAWQDDDWLVPNKKHILEDLTIFLEHFTKPHEYKGEDEIFIYNDAPLLKEMVENLITFIIESESYELYISES